MATERLEKSGSSQYWWRRLSPEYCSSSAPSLVQLSYLHMALHCLVQPPRWPFFLTRALQRSPSEVHMTFNGPWTDHNDRRSLAWTSSFHKDPSPNVPLECSAQHTCDAARNLVPVSSTPNHLPFRPTPPSSSSPPTASTANHPAIHSSSSPANSPCQFPAHPY